MEEQTTQSLTNQAFALTVQLQGREIDVQLQDLASGRRLVHGPYCYHARRQTPEGALLWQGLTNTTAALEGEWLLIRGSLAGLALEQRFWLPPDRPILEEEIRLRNTSSAPIALADLSLGFQCRLTDRVGRLLPALAADRMAAVPFRHRPSDPAEWDEEWSLEQLLRQAGREPRVTDLAPLPQGHGYLPSRRRFSEGWAWSQGDQSLGIFKFNQAAMEFSVLAVESDADGALLRFAGCGMLGDEPSCLAQIQPGQTVVLGVTRLTSVTGGYEQVAYAFRAFLDERGCRFPPGFNPPVHWNEIYDNPEYILGSPGQPPGPRMTRPFTYTRDLILAEAAKALEYSCEALYLDPGWDTDFGTFLWGEEWLGERRSFLHTVQQEYGLRVSLHCPLATWMSFDGRGVSSWPQESWRQDAQGEAITLQSWQGGRVGSVCLGSRHYLEEAAARLLDLCADGVTFLMFDGNWWNGGCWNPEHGHPVPYTLEDHCRANLELARRIHACYPDVLIEMHDMVTGGSVMRYTPVYYKYGLSGSYDLNWGFELMWQPIEDIRNGRARGLYYYNLACNVPIYLHVDLRGDNEHALLFWWYASTCRHLGIGGTHESPAVATAHRHAMQRYRRLERFYKRGDFYGAGEEVHIHTLADENACVVNLFNLSDESRIVTGTVDMGQMGLDLDRWYVVPYSHAEGGFDRAAGTYTIRRRLAPWSAQVAEVRAVQTGR